MTLVFHSCSFVSVGLIYTRTEQSIQSKLIFSFLFPILSLGLVSCAVLTLHFSNDVFNIDLVFVDATIYQYHRRLFILYIECMHETEAVVPFFF